MKDPEQQTMFERHCLLRDELKAEIAADEAALLPMSLKAREIFWRNRTRSRAGRVREMCKLRNLLVEKNIHLVRWAVRLLRDKVPSGVEFDDLECEGRYALLQAVIHFDASYGTKFSTYASRAVFKQIKTFIYKVVGHRMRSRPYDSSLERPEATEDGHHEGSGEITLQLDLSDIISRGMGFLSEVEQRVLKLRFPIGQSRDELPMTLEDVGKVIGVTKERIRQIQNKALRSLRVKLADRCWGEKLPVKDRDQDQGEDHEAD